MYAFRPRACQADVACAPDRARRFAEPPQTPYMLGKAGRWVRIPVSPPGLGDPSGAMGAGDQSEGSSAMMHSPILWLLYTILDIYFWFLIANVILSWLVAFNVVNRSNRVVATIGEFLYRITEPVLAPLRRVLPNLGGIDIAPMIVIIGVLFLQQALLAYWPRG